MHVVLAQGKLSYSGPEAPPPDIVQSNFRQGSPPGVQFLDDDDDDEASTDDTASVIIEGVMERRRTLKEAYKHQQQRRLDWSRSTGKKWRLVISCKDYVL
ncbi:hypothetical protein WOLCODRAFT_28123 [Wolfiporia cocos MD-104 SS10]|uniref:Uncharacterized protein n=1 Tax=Wolfiporia cocos (strain MD-104) TaxID=742152 RepID=A0A2H3JGD4_WOLCO|nr:hypothetical protein WOLCODRAFT_28123 [Wolfiporia cocos MD-104 SS10]